MAECPPEVRGLVSELAVETARTAARTPTRCGTCERRRRRRLALVDEQIAGIKSAAAHEPRRRRRRLPELFGDLVPLEQYRIALREKAMGAVG